jgi:hypothetical protein
VDEIKNIHIPGFGWHCPKCGFGIQALNYKQIQSYVATHLGTHDKE